MNCPACTNEMSSHRLEGNYGRAVDVDVCGSCKVLWLDGFESQLLSAEGTLSLFALIHQHRSGQQTPLSESLGCPRCQAKLAHTHDLQRNTRFQYYRCLEGHGRLITFFQFLREKDFVKNLDPGQFERLRRHVKMIHCSNCGAAVDLEKAAVCQYCQSAVSALDPEQIERAVTALKQRADKPAAIDPTLAAKLVMDQMFTERVYEEERRRPSYRGGSNLVDIGLDVLFSILDP